MRLTAKPKEFRLVTELELNRLRWRCRRGMLELDLLLGPFFEAQFKDLSEAQQADFEKLLEEDDPVLLGWFSRKTEAEEPSLNHLVQVILDRVQPSH